MVQGYGGGILLDYADLYGSVPRWSDVQLRLSGYRLDQLLEKLGWMSIVLEDENLDSLAQQELLVSSCLEPEQAASVIQTLVARQQEAALTPDAAPAIAIDITTILNAIKAACWWAPRKELTRTSANWQEFGEALLMLNNLADEALGSADFESIGGLRRWGYYLTTNSLFRHRERYMHAIARAYQLYLTDNSRLRASSANHIDFPALIKRKLGLTPLELWAIIFACMAHFTSLKPSKGGMGRPAINYREYFAGTYDFTPEAIEHFFGLVSQDLNSLAAKIGESYTTTSVRPFSALPLSKYPMILSGPLGFVPFLPELHNKLSLGMHYLVLDLLETASERERFLRYIGEVFEDYVRQLFVRVYSEAHSSVRFIDSSSISAVLRKLPRSKSACDGILQRGDTVILFEAKAKVLSAAARNGHDENAFYSKVEDILVRSARQLHNTVSLIDANVFEPLGIGASSIKRIYPVVISLQPLPMVPLNPGPTGSVLYAWWRKRLEQLGILTDPRISPIQLIDIAECEILEEYLHSGADIVDILESKTRTHLTQGESFLNFFILRLATTNKPTNKFLSVLYEDLAESAIQFFRDRRIAL